ncbi:MAG: Gfo/Idh/MocA family oxidoreductase [Luteolibacter sp.]|jgi:predicted dehydrogenase|nr:Gfo/Idh/MocA family oxidoreductase [Luteolibacter sp.]
MTSPDSTRRRFLKTSAATLLGAPFVTSGAKAAPASQKLRHLAFGAGSMSWVDIIAFSTHPNWELAAVCDVDTRTFAQVKEKFPNVRTYVDWREALEKEAGQVDSVHISTPDHMHAAIGMAAISKGLHVYGQKPLTQNLAECRTLTRFAHEKGIVTQMGIQISSSFGERFTVEMIHRGDIGKVKEVHSFSNKKWGDMDPVPIARAASPPTELDWDKWLGVSAERPFIPDYYHPSNWRKRRDFGTGTLGDMGCHMFSGWYRALSLTMPLSVTSLGPPPPNAENWANDGKVEYIYPGTIHTADKTVKVTWYDGDQLPPKEVLALLGDIPWPDQGSLYIGTDGVLLHQHGSTPKLLPREKFQGIRPPKLEARNHWYEFVDCCLAGGSNRKPSANFDYAGPLTEAVLLGCLASIFPKQTLEWNAEKMLFTNSAEATKFVKRRYRPGWEIPGL